MDEKEKEKSAETKAKQDPRDAFQRKETAKDLLEAAPNLVKLGLTSNASNKEQMQGIVWALLASYLPEDVRTIEKWFVHHVEYTLAQVRQNVTPGWAFRALALSVRDRLIERWKDTQIYFQEKHVKRVAYLSMEFLLGRSLQNAIFNLRLKENFGTAMNNLGMNLETLYEKERDAGLGNGGLGRLAACFMDSLATLDYPAWGYGLRYTYGMFHQEIRDGEQFEVPDYWLQYGNPWEVERLDVTYAVQFYGRVKEEEIGKGKIKYHWEAEEEVIAVAYDTPIPGYNTFNTLNIRLWSARPGTEFDLQAFSSGDFYEAVAERQKADTITAVLYPNDNTEKGKELRLKQQYFFVSATLKDMIRRFKKKTNDFAKFPEAVAIQLNDTHPSLAIVELMRLLIDIENYEWNEAWDITTKVFGYTNHTVLPEALERWPVVLMEKLLPRHMKIIYGINLFFLQSVEKRWPGDIDRLRKMSIIEEDPRMVRMAHLAIIGSHAVNGVAKIHSELVKHDVFPYFYELWPKKFFNKTNGVTPRRWVHQANPRLADLLTKYLGGSDWLLDLSLIKHMEKFADDHDAQRDFLAVKQHNKQRLVAFLKKKYDMNIDPNSLFDVQVKRIHEYKRQLMNILGVIYLYRRIKQMTAEEKQSATPRTVFIGGKAAPGYYMAKLIIKFINAVSKVVNNDKEVNGLLKVYFIPNYCVSLAELIIPASDISQHISTAGMEASGTSNMKFAMNSSLILGTLDGANIEIMEEIGKENIYIFGATVDEVPELRKQLRERTLEIDPRFNQVIAMIEIGLFGQPNQWMDIVKSITNGNDYYLVSHDFSHYLDSQIQIARDFKDKSVWGKKMIFSTARSGYFSSDRTIIEYAKEIWEVEPMRRPGPVSITVGDMKNEGLLAEDLASISQAVSSNEIALERLTPHERRSMATFAKKDDTHLAPTPLHRQVGFEAAFT